MDLSRPRPAVPTADERYNVEERIAMRANQFDNLPCGRAGVKKMLYSSYDVLKQDNLERSRVRHHRNCREGR